MTALTIQSSPVCMFVRLAKCSELKSLGSWWVCCTYISYVKESGSFEKNISWKLETLLFSSFFSAKYSGLPPEYLCCGAGSHLPVWCPAQWCLLHCPAILLLKFRQKISKDSKNWVSISTYLKPLSQLILWSIMPPFLPEINIGN